MLIPRIHSVKGWRHARHLWIQPIWDKQERRDVGEVLGFKKRNDSFLFLIVLVWFYFWIGFSFVGQLWRPSGCVGWTVVDLFGLFVLFLFCCCCLFSFGAGGEGGVGFVLFIIVYLLLLICLAGVLILLKLLITSNLRFLVISSKLKFRVSVEMKNINALYLYF